MTNRITVVFNAGAGGAHLGSVDAHVSTVRVGADGDVRCLVIPGNRVRAGDVRRGHARGYAPSLRGHDRAHGARSDATMCPAPSMHQLGATAS